MYAARKILEHTQTCRLSHQKKHLSRLAFSPRHPTNDALKNESGGEREREGVTNSIEMENAAASTCALFRAVWSVCLPSQMEYRVAQVVVENLLLT